MVTRDTFLPGGSLQKSVIPYPGNHDSPTRRAAGKQMGGQNHALQCSVHGFNGVPVFVNMLVARLGTLKISHVSLVLTQPLLGKYSPALSIHIGGQHKAIFVCKNGLQVKIRLTGRQVPHTINIFGIIGPLLLQRGIAVVEPCKW